MRRIPILFLIVTILLPSCSIVTGRTSKVVKPKYHHSWFNKKKDKKTKRTRVVRMKS